MTDFHRSAQWQAFTKTARPIIKAQLPLPCLNTDPARGCSGVVLPGERFDVAHIPGFDHMLVGRMPTLSEVGAAHSSCNRAAGAKLAAQRRAKRKARAERMPAW
ncbi:hypothetical protein [Microbacterium paludicola]|uniref:hypothetical protein n=1 Tax=Microbacterium paludicola TaxID=300019 RepID=UPI0016427FBB|nr:hypothetical protein [Microbacterium paludicola]